MSTIVESTIPDEVFEAQITSALASLEGSSAAELTEEAIAKHLLEADGDKSLIGVIEPGGVDFRVVNVITVTVKSSAKPISEGTTISTYKKLSRGLVG